MPPIDNEDVEQQASPNFTRPMSVSVRPSSYSQGVLQTPITALPYSVPPMSAKPFVGSARVPTPVRSATPFVRNSVRPMSVQRMQTPTKSPLTTTQIASARPGVSDFDFDFASPPYIGSSRPQATMVPRTPTPVAVGNASPQNFSRPPTPIRVAQPTPMAQPTPFPPPTVASSIHQPTSVFINAQTPLRLTPQRSRTPLNVETVQDGAVAFPTQQSTPREPTPLAVANFASPEFSYPLPPPSRTVRVSPVVERSPQSTPQPTPPEDMCFGNILESFEEVPLSRIEGVSDSVILFGKLKPHKLANETNDNVVMKIAPLVDPRPEGDNGLQVERTIYMKIHDEVIRDTPHVLPGLLEKQCTDQTILAMGGLPSDQFPAEASFYQAWVQLRSRVVPQVPLTQPIELGFIVTPRLFDISLHRFLTEPWMRIGDTPVDRFELTKIIAMVAQCLITLKKYQIMHHDLHTGNVFLQKLTTPRKITYSYPELTETKKKSFVTRFVPVIYDFDHGYGTGFANNNTKLTHHFCESLGECNEFVNNYDWYTFLTYFFKDLEAANLNGANIKTPPLLDGVFAFDRHRKMNSWNRPCRCTQGSAMRCAQCQLKIDFLDKMMSPERFFEIAMGMYGEE